MENIKANPTASDVVTSEYVKLIDGTDYEWDNDRKEMVIEKKGFVGEHSDIILSDTGDSISIKRIWIKGKEINADTMWCRESKTALSTMLDDTIKFVRQEKDVVIVNEITKTYDDGIVQVNVKEFKNDVEVPVTIDKIAIAIVEKVDKDKIAHDSFLSNDMDEEIKEAYLALDTDEKRREFRDNYSRMKIAQGLVSTASVEENRIIKADDIDSNTAVSIMKSETENHSNISTNTQDNFKVLREKLKRQVTNDYIVKRGRTINGELDRLLTMKEVKEIDDEVSKLIESDKKLQVSADMSKINGVYDTINNRNLDSQIAYEVKKETFCNVYGYTPESFDSYMNEIFRLQEEKLTSGGYAKEVSSSSGDGFEEVTTIKSMLNNDDVESKARAKLVKVDGWDDLPYRDKPILYRSELLLAVIEQDKKDMDPEKLKKLREEDPNGMRLYDLMNDTIYSIDRWQKIRKRRKGEQDNVTLHKRSAAAKSDVEKFMEERKAARDEKKQSGEIINKIPVEIKPIKIEEPEEINVIDAYNDLMGDDIEAVEIKNTEERDDYGHYGNDTGTDYGGREAGQDGSSTDGREHRAIRSEATPSSKDVTSSYGDRDTRWEDGDRAQPIESISASDTRIGDEYNREESRGIYENSEIIIDSDDIEIVEVIDDDRRSTTGDSSEVSCETQHGDRPSEVQGNINHEEPESQEEVTNVIPRENRISEEIASTIGRRVYSENSASISNIRIEEENKNDYRENDGYNDTSSNDNTNYNDTNSNTSSSYLRSERRDNDIQSKEVSKEINIKQDSERQSSRELPSRNREIEMAERTEVKILNITSDGKFILDNGRTVTPDEFKKMKEEGTLTVEDMLKDDEEEKAPEPQRVRITDDNLDNMFKLITLKKATWNQRDDRAIVIITDDPSEYVYEPVSKFINKYTEYAMNSAISQTTPSKLKDVEEIKENLDTIIEKKPKNQHIKDRLDAYMKSKEQQDNTQDDMSEVEVVEVKEVTDLVDAAFQIDEDKFKEYDRPLEAKIVKMPDNYFVDRHRELRGKLDNISGVTKQDGDMSLLRNVNRFERFRDFWDSATYSRDLYLPNSNYTVIVKRLRNRNKLTWMFKFLEDIKDSKMAEEIARPDIMSTVYEQLDFPFEERPSEEEFLKNLHQTDVTLLMSMFALVNLPEDKDERVIIPNISKFVCHKCGKPAFLKNPISLDIKEEFFAIYPEALWHENYGAYKQAKYPTIQKAYRASKVGKRYMITNNNADDPFRTDIIISRPTVYKSSSVESNRLDVCYDLRLEELSNLLSKPTAEGNIPDEMLKAISYMSERSFREVRNRILMLDDIDLNKDPEEIPEGSRAQYKEFQEEAKIIQFITSEIEQTNAKLAQVFNACQYIDSMVYVDKETNKPIFIIDHKNLNDMIDSIQYLSDPTVNAINKQIEELKNGYNGISTNITFTFEEMKGKFRWDDVYQVIKGKVMSESEFLTAIQNEGGYSDSDMKEVAELRQKYKSNLEEGKCVCGNEEPWTLNWTDLLFFSTAKILLQTINTEPDRSFLL